MSPEQAKVNQPAVRHGQRVRQRHPALSILFQYNSPGPRLSHRRTVIIRALATLQKATPLSDVTRILSKIESGDPSAAEQLLPLVYEELRKLAAAKLAHEKPGQTLQATALVHEAYVRLVDDERVQHWNSRGHFFGAAAEAMRRILVEQARRKERIKHGGEFQPLGSG